MPDAILPPAAAATATPFDPALIFTILVEEPRRRMLLALAGGQPLSADALGGAAGRTRGATLKHLALLSEAGLVLARPDPAAGQPRGRERGGWGDRNAAPRPLRPGQGGGFSQLAICGRSLGQKARQPLGTAYFISMTKPAIALMNQEIKRKMRWKT